MMNYPSVDLQLPSSYQPGTTTTMTKQQSGSTQASDYTKLLNVKERKELEVPMSLYVNIKLLNSIENLYSREYITKDQYNDKFQEVMEKISKIENVMTSIKPSFNINNFIDEYGLNDCVFAITVLRKIKQDNNEGDERTRFRLVSNVTTNFLRIGDLYWINNEQYPVKDILASLEQMVVELAQIKRWFAREFSLSSKYQSSLSKHKQKDISETLSKEDSKDIFDLNQYTKTQFELFLKQ